MDGSDSAIDRKAVLQLAGRAGLAPEAVPADSRLVERAVAPFLAELLRNATTLAQHWCRVDVLASDIEDAVALHHRASAASTSFMLFEHDAEDDCEADSDWEGSSMSGSEDDSSDEAESELSSILSDSDASYLSSQSLDEVALQLESLSGLVLSDTHLERLIGLAGVLALTLTPEARLLCRVLLENNLVAALQGETNCLGVDLRVLCRLRLLEERASLTPSAELTGLRQALADKTNHADSLAARYRAIQQTVRKLADLTEDEVTDWGCRKKQCTQGGPEGGPGSPPTPNAYAQVI